MHCSCAHTEDKSVCTWGWFWVLFQDPWRSPSRGNAPWSRVQERVRSAIITITLTSKRLQWHRQAWFIKANFVQFGSFIRQSSESEKVELWEELYKYRNMIGMCGRHAGSSAQRAQWLFVRLFLSFFVFMDILCFLSSQASGGQPRSRSCAAAQRSRRSRARGLTWTVSCSRCTHAHTHAHNSI